MLILCVKILMPAKKLSIREELMGIFDELKVEITGKLDVILLVCLYLCGDERN